MHAVDASVQQGLHASRDVLYHQLQQCARRKDLAAGREVHSCIVFTGLDRVPVFIHHLLRFYVTCASLSEAVQVFEASKPDIFTYNAIMSAHAKLGDAHRTLELFERLEAAKLNPDTCTFLSVLNACGRTAASWPGRLIHDRIIREGLDTSIIVSNSVIDMYGKCACLDEGSRVFDISHSRNVVTWATIITGYSKNNHEQIVLELYCKMKQADLKPNDVIFSCVLRAVGKLGLLSVGRFVHEDIICAGLDEVEIIIVGLIDMHAKCKQLEDAWNVFLETDSLNVVTWNTIIMAYAENGNNCWPFVLFQKMLQKSIEPDNVSYLGVLKTSANNQDLEQGRTLHHTMLQSCMFMDLTLTNSLMNMYSNCGSIEDAQDIFDSLSNPDVSSWSTIIDGYAEHGDGCVALEVFGVMQHHGVKPNDVTFVSTLKACIQYGSREYSHNLHDQVIRAAMESNAVIGSTIVDMYAKHGRLEEARTCFEKMEDPDVVAWGAMMCGYIQQGQGDLGLQMFVQMLCTGVKATEGIYVPILQACVHMDTVELGRLLHEYIIKCGFQTNVPIQSSLVNLYASFGLLDDARVLFDKVEHFNKDVVTWGSMIAGSVQYSEYDLALSLFGKFYRQNIEPNRVIFLSILKACSVLGSIIYGKILHKEIIEIGLEKDGIVANTLIDMYIKCGSKQDAQNVFYKLSGRDAISWSVILSGNAQLGDSTLSLKYFDAMRQEGLQPDETVFTNVLAAFSHEGAPEKCLVCFKDMSTMHDIVPGFQHFCCVADLLGRAGLFAEAEDLLCSLPTSENFVGWTSLLTGCNTYGIVVEGHKCFDAITE